MNFIQSFKAKAESALFRAATSEAIKRSAIAAVVVLSSTHANAAGLADLVANVTTLMNATKTAVVAIFGVVGLCAIGYSGKLLWDKGGERGDDIKVSKIMFSLIGGVVCLAITFFGVMTLQTAGGSAADIGRTQ